MTNRKNLVLVSTVIACALLFPRHAQADDSNEYLAEALTQMQTADGIANNEVIDEIIVLGQRHRRLRFPDHVPSTDPLLDKLRQFEWQFFPAYSPDPARNRFELGPSSELTRKSGLITVFRIRFGN